MRPKYKISKGNLQEFFGWFKKEKKPQEIQQIIKNDPVLQKLDSDIKNLNDKASDYIEKIKKEDPETYAAFKKYGMID
jgi:hypothetical protein